MSGIDQFPEVIWFASAFLVCLSVIGFVYGIAGKS